MGEAKNRKIAGDMDYWYHGTEETFSTWDMPPVKAKYKPELLPHPFISFSKDRTLAESAGRTCGGLCRVKLAATAKILDLRQRSAETERHWETVRKSPFGAIHRLVQSFDTWTRACSSGEILRIHPEDGEVGRRLDRLQVIARGNSGSVQQRALAFLEVQNATRSWINDVMAPASDLGYDGVICAEVDRFRHGGSKACLNLYIFNPRAISQPDWISVANTALIEPHLAKVRELGLAS